MKVRIYAILEVAFIALFVFSCFKIAVMVADYRIGDNIYETSKDYFKVSDDGEGGDKLDFEIDLSSLKSINEDIKGWIYIPDTEISYPLLYDDNNDYYLKHTYNNIYSDFGSIFIDYRCSDSMQNQNTIIYGHNTKNGSMFGSLKKYKSQSYLEEHPLVYLIFDSKVYTYKIISAFTAQTSDSVYTIGFESEENYAEWLQSICKLSEVGTDKLDFENNEKVITLTTCTSRTKTERFVVIAEEVL